MSLAVITGSAGLIGSEASRHFSQKGLEIVGIDNNMRQRFFGPEASTQEQVNRLRNELRHAYRHCDLDIRNAEAMDAVFGEYGKHISLIIHTAAQPSHDWAAREPQTDFAVNAVGTLNLLEATRRHCPNAVFIFTSTNKVYGDRPNRLPLVETSLRWEIDPNHPYAGGIPEEMPIDQCLHSVFGASKVAADVMVQEYGRYFGIRTACFRGGCLTGPNHAGTQLHGFLAYLVRCAATSTPYTVFGYGGKQVRDNIHSADLVQAFDCFFESPRVSEVYNIGGGRHSNCSMLEAIGLCERLTGRPVQWRYSETSRVGDHIWWVSDLRKFRSHYPNWQLRYDVSGICREIYESNVERWSKELIPS